MHIGGVTGMIFRPRLLLNGKVNGLHNRQLPIFLDKFRGMYRYFAVYWLIALDISVVLPVVKYPVLPKRVHDTI